MQVGLHFFVFQGPAGPWLFRLSVFQDGNPREESDASVNRKEIDHAKTDVIQGSANSNNLV